VRRTVPPSAEIEAQIDQLLAVGVGDNPRESLSELARLGARLIIRRAVEDEFDAWLGRARYERRPEYQRGLRNDESGLRNGFRARTVQTAEGELSVEIRQVREAAQTFASKLFPRTPKLLRTGPLKALVIGGSCAGCRCATSSRCASRPGSASCRSRPRHGSARSCASASSSSRAGISTTPTWWRCFSGASFGLGVKFIAAGRS
jgi:hypothetical protein